MLPTRIPTSVPTLLPTSIPTTIPTLISTAIPISVSTTLQESEISEIEIIEDWESASMIIISLDVGIGVIVMFMSLIHNKSCVDSSARFYVPQHYRVLSFFVNVSDFHSDILFSVILTISNEKDEIVTNSKYRKIYQILSVLAWSFVAIPYFIQLLASIHFVQKWKKSNDGSKRLKSYLDKYDVLVYLFSIMSGNFYATIDLLKSQVFYLKRFSFAIKTDEYTELKHFRFININVCENLSQLAIQIGYIVLESNEKSDDWNESSNIFESNQIVFVSMFFSVLSLLLAFTKEASLYCDKSRKMERKNGLTQLTTINGYFTLESKHFHYYHNFTHNRIAKCLESLLDTCNDSHNWRNRTDFIYSLQVYYIKDMISTMNTIEAFFEMKIFCLAAETSKIILQKFVKNLMDIHSPGTINNHCMSRNIAANLKIKKLNSISISPIPLQIETKHTCMTNKKKRNVDLGASVSSNSFSNSTRANLVPNDDNDNTSNAKSSNDVNGTNNMPIAMEQKDDTENDSETDQGKEGMQAQTQVEYSYTQTETKEGATTVVVTNDDIYTN